MSEYIEREAANEVCRECVRKYPNSFYNGIEAVRSELRKRPAADVRPVARAHWYWDKDGMDWNIGAWRCSACHSRPETWWQGDSNSPRNKSGHYFCPNCGAMMEES